jgi:hypothetical protein
MMAPTALSGKCLGVEICSVKRGALVPDADCVFAGHFMSPEKWNTGDPPPRQ